MLVVGHVFSIGDVVINEYGHAGRILSINGFEVEMSVVNYGIEGDTDWCNYCFLHEISDVELLQHTNNPQIT
jgi:hypothetical protein